MPQLPRLPTLKTRARREGWLRWVRSEADERAMLAGMKFDLANVERVQRFGERCLRLFEGDSAGRPFIWMDWQHNDLFGPLFGWKKYSNHYKKWVRRYSRVYCEVAKKNGKSPTGAFIGTYMLVGDGEPSAKVFSAATTEGQASIVHDHAIKMVDASPILSPILKINKTTKTISHAQSLSTYRALASGAAAAEGLNASCIICDELHAWPGRELWDCLKWAFASRSQPILFSITTAGDNTESVCREQHNYARSVNRNEIHDLGFLGLIYAPDDGDDEHSPESWKKANPAWGVTIDPEGFQADYEEAKRNPGNWAAFKRYRLNRWGIPESAWLRAGAWKECQIDDELANHVDETCFAGLDLATVKDLSALCLTFPENTKTETTGDQPAAETDLKKTFDTNHYRCFWFHWLPEATANEYRKRLPIDDWIENGWLELTPGDVTDYSFIKKRIVEIAELFNLHELVFDPWKAEEFTQDLELNHGIRRVEFRQTIASYAEPTSEVERLILNKQIHHDGNRLVAWQAGHVAVITDANANKRPVKPKPNSLQKIDGIVALIMAHSRAMRFRDRWGSADDYEIQRF